MFDKIQRFYHMGLYTPEMVHQFAQKGVISEEQYAAITRRDAP